MSPTKIGYFDKGLLNVRQDVLAESTGVNGVSYERALSAARSTPGADLIVARQTGETFAYDVLAITIKKGQVAGAGKFLQLVDNVPGQLSATEAVLVDENNAAQILLAPNAKSDTSRGEGALTHA